MSSVTNHFLFALCTTTTRAPSPPPALDAMSIVTNHIRVPSGSTAATNLVTMTTPITTRRHRFRLDVFVICIVAYGKHPSLQKGRGKSPRQMLHSHESHLTSVKESVSYNGFQRSSNLLRSFPALFVVFMYLRKWLRFLRNQSRKMVKHSSAFAFRVLSLVGMILNSLRGFLCFLFNV
ncbi:hypothetical protein FPQ18DRAFT_306623 [Pyronema domesticum]|nr:hypothetical protein FPQ18DRAFT_306623 [Pyronema domesticum]